ncbi:MAG: ABC transporter ATP-binding protein [Bacteroides sp.]|nr:ABC transporter ATP-binding protein [Bacteroides sp.]
MDIFLEKLKKCYGSHVALNIDQYTLAGGEIVGLVGNNGAGKTTLFRLMLDLLKADDGCVRIGDIDVSHSEEWKEFTGAYLDESFLIDYLTPEEYFHFIGKICGLDTATVDERLAVYERFMNGEILGQKKFIRNLSAGNKQKVGILAALLNRPQLLVLDEPFNFLDPSSQSALKHLLREYHQETGATILVSSHNLNHTVDISSHIILLEHGLIIRDLQNTDGTAEKELEAYFEIEE